MSSTLTGEVEYESPNAAEDVHRLLADSESAKLVAGGQSLMLMLRQGLVDADLLIDISDVPELTGIETTDDRIHLKAATTYSELSNHGLSDLYTELGDAVDVIADEQIRNMGTIGGAVSHADPSLDIVPPLLCLDAEVTISSLAGTRSVPLQEFLAGYMDTDIASDEVLEEITFDRRNHNTTGGVYQKHTKVKGGWPVIGVSSVVEVSDDGQSFDSVRVALSAAGYTALRSHSVEETLESQPTTQEAIGAAAASVTDDIDPIPDPSGTVSYKEHLAEVLTERALSDALERTGGDQ